MNTPSWLLIQDWYRCCLEPETGIGNALGEALEPMGGISILYLGAITECFVIFPLKSRILLAEVLPLYSGMRELISLGNSCILGNLM